MGFERVIDIDARFVNDLTQESRDFVNHHICDDELAQTLDLGFYILIVQDSSSSYISYK
jgi:hypothetical protein